MDRNVLDIDPNPIPEVALRKAGVDRTNGVGAYCCSRGVALHAEGVDRNDVSNVADLQSAGCLPHRRIVNSFQAITYGALLSEKGNM